MPQDPRFRNHKPTASSVAGYLRGYVAELSEAIAEVPDEAVEKAFDLLRSASEQGRIIYVAGNGGSAAISDHLCCDWMKGTQAPGHSTLKVVSMASSTALLTAIANDFSYDECFSRQVEMLGEAGDVLVLISSSGNSPNVVEAAEAAHRQGMKVIGMSGFAGGKLAALADAPLHVPVDNYGMAEDCHQMLMHVFAQFLAQLRDQMP